MRLQTLETRYAEYGIRNTVSDHPQANGFFLTAQTHSIERHAVFRSSRMCIYLVLVFAGTRGRKEGCIERLWTFKQPAVVTMVSMEPRETRTALLTALRRTRRKIASFEGCLKKDGGDQSEHQVSLRGEFIDTRDYLTCHARLKGQSTCSDRLESVFISHLVGLR